MVVSTAVRASFSTAHGGCAVKSAVIEGAARPISRDVTSKPIDLVHLSKQSLGDRALEMEILGLFRSQSKLFLERLTNATTASERKFAAHTILGSARGVGAWNVAKEAEKLQNADGSKCDLYSLKAALEEANTFITYILEG